MAIDISTMSAVVSQAVVGIGRGSGTVIGDGMVVTTAHNVTGMGDHEGPLRVHLADGQHVDGTLSASSEDLDLAVVAVDTAGIVPVRWGAVDELATGQAIVAAAAPRGILRLTGGTIATTAGRLHTRTGSPVGPVLEHTAPLPRGASGGPVFDGAGAVIAIDTNRLGGGLYQAVIATADLQAAVDALASGVVPATPRLGVSVARTRQAQAMRAAVGLDPLDGVLLTGVDPEGPAAAAGLSRGDLLTTVDGVPVGRVDDLRLRLRQARAGTVALTVVRGAGEPRTVTVALTPAA